MRSFPILLFLLGAVSASAGAAEPAAPPMEEKSKVEIVSRGPDGKPDVVRVEGYEYKVCKGGQTDSCINPQDAGFDWGGKEIDYWPGKPASEIDEKLPEHKPADPPPAKPS